MQCVIYISNKSQNLENEERYGKTIDGDPFILGVLSNKTNLIFISYTLYVLKALFGLASSEYISSVHNILYILFSYHFFFS